MPVRSYHLVVFLRKITYEQTTESFGASLRFSPADPRTRFIRDFFLFVAIKTVENKNPNISRTNCSLYVDNYRLYYVIGSGDFHDIRTFYYHTWDYQSVLQFSTHCAELDRLGLKCVTWPHNQIFNGLLNGGIIFWLWSNLQFYILVRLNIKKLKTCNFQLRSKIGDKKCLIKIYG